jgi:hypothetical protein
MLKTNKLEFIQNNNNKKKYMPLHNIYIYILKKIQNEIYMFNSFNV